jgi:hypothetical protein
LLSIPSLPLLPTVLLLPLLLLLLVVVGSSGISKWILEVSRLGQTGSFGSTVVPLSHLIPWKGTEAGN